MFQYWPRMGPTPAGGEFFLSSSLGRLAGGAAGTDGRGVREGSRAIAEQIPYQGISLLDFMITKDSCTPAIKTLRQEKSLRDNVVLVRLLSAKSGNFRI